MRTIVLLIFLVSYSPAFGKPMAEWDDIDKKIWETLQQPHPDETDQTWLTPEIRIIAIAKNAEGDGGSIL